MSIPKAANVPNVWKTNRFFGKAHSLNETIFQTFGRAKLRSQKAAHAECEAEWSLLGLWAMLLHAQIQQQCSDDVSGLSVAFVLQAFGQAIDEYRCRRHPNESLTEQLRTAIVDTYADETKPVVTILAKIVKPKPNHHASPMQPASNANLHGNLCRKPTKKR